MNETIPKGRTGRGAPWGLIGMIGLVVLAEASVARRGLDLLDMDDWAYRKNVRLAARGAGRYDVLCFGDSLIKLGVVPRAVEERSGLRVCNLAVSGSQAPASYVMLRRVLDSGAKPSAVVVDFQPPLLRLGPRHNLTRWANIMTPFEAAELARWARDPDLFATVALGRLLPSYHRRTGVRANVMGALSGAGDPRRFQNFLAFRNWSRNGGAQLMLPSPAMKTMTEKEALEIRRAFYPAWECHPANVAGLERFLALAAEHDVPVYWVLPPLLPALQTQLARSGIDARHEAFIRSWQDRYPNLVVIDGRNKVSDPDAFFDANHLSGGGAYAFSLALGDALRQARRGDRGVPANRWVALPEFRVGPIPKGFEDINQSQVALEAMGKATR